jgi:hypothetical protein
LETEGLVDGSPLGAVLVVGFTEGSELGDELIDGESDGAELGAVDSEGYWLG